MTMDTGMQGAASGTDTQGSIAAVSPDTPPAGVRTVYLKVVLALQCAAAMAGLFFGYGIGEQIGGILVAVIMATSSAVFGWLMVSMLADWARPASAAGRKP